MRSPKPSDEGSNPSTYDIISSVSSAGRTARLGREGRVFKSPTGELSGIGTAATALALGVRNHRRFESFIPDFVSCLAGPHVKQKNTAVFAYIADVVNVAD